MASFDPPTVAAHAVDGPSSEFSASFHHPASIAGFASKLGLLDGLTLAMPSPAGMSRDSKNNTAASDALIPPPPPPSLMITKEDDGAYWPDSISNPSADAGLHGPGPTLGALHDATRYMENGMIGVRNFDLESTGGVSLLRTQYTGSWDTSPCGDQSPFNNRYSKPTMHSYNIFTVTPSFSTGRGDPSRTPFDCSRPGMSRISSSSGSSSWVISTPASDSDTSMLSDGEQEDISAELQQFSTVVDAPPRGPCSKTWLLPPRTRRRRKVKTENSGKKRYRKSDANRRRGPFKDDQKRQNTALTRVLKGCIRCRMMRIRCEPDAGNLGGDCLTCQRAQQSRGPSIRRLPCLRWIITDVSLYREQDMPCQLFSRRWQSMDLVDITDWASTETKTIVLSQIYLDAPYAVQVREFVPVDGDMLETTWSSGSVVRHQRMPAYALADMESVAQTLERFTSHFVPTYIRETVGELDLLIWNTYYFAFQQQAKAKTQRERDLIKNCLRFWVGCRKTSHPERIFSKETLGGTPVDDRSSPFYNMVPMPPIMIAQMECIMYTRVLRPLSRQVLSELRDLIMENKRENWLTIYLTLFILLHSCAMLTRRDWETARQYDLQDEYANLRSIQAMQSGMLTMLAHFHYLNKGVLPFHLTYDEHGLKQLAAAAELDREQLEFVRRTSSLVNHPARVARMDEIRTYRRFGDDLYWVSQLYDSEWRPGPTA